LKGGLGKRNQIDKRIKKFFLKEWGPYLEKITNHDYGFKDEIENKLKFNKRAKNKYYKLKNKDQSWNVVNDRATLKFWMASAGFDERRERTEKEERIGCYWHTIV